MLLNSSIYVFNSYSSQKGLILGYISGPPIPAPDVIYIYILLNIFYYSENISKLIGIKYMNVTIFKISNTLILITTWSKPEYFFGKAPYNYE